MRSSASAARSMLALTEDVLAAGQVLRDHHVVHDLHVVRRAARTPAVVGLGVAAAAVPPIAAARGLLAPRLEGPARAAGAGHVARDRVHRPGGPLREGTLRDVRAGDILHLAAGSAPAQGLRADEFQRHFEELFFRQRRVLSREAVLVTTAVLPARRCGESAPCCRESARASLGKGDGRCVGRPRDLRGLPRPPHCARWQRRELAPVVALLGEGRGLVHAAVTAGRVPAAGQPTRVEPVAQQGKSEVADKSESSLQAHTGAEPGARHGE